MKLNRFASFALTAILAFLATPAISSASPASDDAINTVKLAINAINKGNMSAFVALCDSPTVVIDTFDPYLMGERPVAPTGGTHAQPTTSRRKSRTSRPASARRGTCS